MTRKTLEQAMQAMIDILPYVNDWHGEKSHKVCQAIGKLSEEISRPRLTDDEITAIAESMPGGLDGFLKGWGWQQFARAIEFKVIGDE